MPETKDHHLFASAEGRKERPAKPPGKGDPRADPLAADDRAILYRRVFEECLDAQLRVDSDGIIREANPAAAEMYGLSREELAGRPLASLVLNPGRCQEALRRVLHQGPLHRWETVHLRQDGRHLFLLANAVRLAAGDETLIACALHDLTDYRPRRGPLPRWDAVLEAAAFASGQVITPEGHEPEVHKILACLGQAAGVHRVFLFRKRLDADGAPYISHHGEWTAPGILPLRHHPQLRSLHYETEGFLRWGQVLDDGGHIAGPVNTFPRDERRLLSRFSIKSVALVPILAVRNTWGLLGFDDCEHDRVWSMAEMEALRAAATAIGMAVQREHWERQIRESEEKYRNLVEFLPDGVAIVQDGAIVLANSALVRIGAFRNPDELIGKPVRELFHPDSRNAADRGIRQIIDGHQALAPTEFRFAQSPSSPVIVEVTGTAFPHDEAPACLLVFRDVTARKALDEHLHKVQKMEALAILAGGLAHDFANLLQVLTSSLHLLRKRLEAQDPATGAEMASLEAHVKRGAALTRRLLLFTRHEVGLTVTVDLNAVVKEAARFIRRLLRDDISLRLELHPGPLWIKASPEQLEEVLLNLVINAQDAMPGGGLLGIRTGSPEEGKVCLAVTDTGTGIPAAIQPHIFEPFFSTKGSGQGTGLGLPVVQRIALEHGGTADVRSQEGFGSTFLVTLPAAEEPREKSAAGDPAAPPSECRGEWVLLVEDEPLARDGLHQIIENLGYRVTSAASAESALEIADRRPHQILLTDLSLPGQSGVNLARALRERLPDLQVIVMSGFVAEETQRCTAELPGARFLQKPIDTDQVARELANARTRLP